MLLHAVACDLVQHLAAIGADATHGITDGTPEQQADQPLEHTGLRSFEPGTVEGVPSRHDHVAVIQRRQHLGHIAGLDLQAGRENQDRLAPGALEGAAQRSALSVPAAQHDHRERFPGALERAERGQGLLRLPRQDVDELDLARLAVQRRLIGTMQVGDRAVVLQHRDDRRNDPGRCRRGDRCRGRLRAHARSRPHQAASFLSQDAGAASAVPTRLTARRSPRRYAARTAMATGDRRHIAKPTS